MSKLSAILRGSIAIPIFACISVSSAGSPEPGASQRTFPRHSTPLPSVPAPGAAEPTPARVLPPAGGSWHTATAAPVSGLCNPLLLTDGRVMVHECNAPNWYTLTPDSSGNYANGKWSPIASLPVINGTQYQPQYNASAVLPDGRVLIAGGEYNGSSTEVRTNLAAIYDPVANKWTPVKAPSGTAWSEIGDAQSVILADGTLMLAACCADPAADALLDPATLHWSTTGAPNAGGGYQDEQGYELLPNGNVLTIDVWTNYPNGNATNAEQYVAASSAWTTAGDTPVSLVDPVLCGNYEIGPAVVRPDGTLVAFGGNTGCAALVKAQGTAAAADPTAIYNTKTSTWSAGPHIPAVCKATTKFPTKSCTLADAPAAVLPNGNILFAASSGYGQIPTHFFEFGTSNTIQQVADTILFAGSSSSFYYNFLVLPNGQVLATDFSSTVELYTPAGTPKSSWAPTISSTGYPKTVTRGSSYTIRGKQFNGLSQGAYYGDDAEGSTNYPIVKIQNVASGKVVYARTAHHSTMSIAPGASASTTFSVPKSTPTGASKLFVIANGISSLPVQITVN